MYVFILAVLADCYLMWRGFKRVLADRLPGAPTRGLMMYGVNRSIQIRRFRMPAPRLKRGDTVLSVPRPVLRGATPRAGVSAPTA